MTKAQKQVLHIVVYNVVKVGAFYLFRRACGNAAKRMIAEQSKSN